MGTIKIFLERLKSELQKLRSRRVEGLLVASAHNAQARDWKRAFANLVVPVIFIDRRFPRIPFVGGDDEEIGLQATTHLAEQGYRRIAHICGPHTVATAIGRRKGYLKALKKLSLRLVPEFIIESKYHDTGLQIPERFGLIGVGGHQYSKYLRVPLSTVDQQRFRIGQDAARLMLEFISGMDAGHAKQILVEPHLVIRASSSRLQRLAPSFALSAAPSPTARLKSFANESAGFLKSWRPIWPGAPVGVHFYGSPGVSPSLDWFGLPWTPDLIAPRIAPTIS
ncbi:MAG: substrate-binding domain-containing protein [Terrimicrobiaceae bacterium]